MSNEKHIWEDISEGIEGYRIGTDLASPDSKDIGVTYVILPPAQFKAILEALKGLYDLKDEALSNSVMQGTYFFEQFDEARKVLEMFNVDHK